MAVSSTKTRKAYFLSELLIDSPLDFGSECLEGIPYRVSNRYIGCRQSTMVCGEEIIFRWFANLGMFLGYPEMVYFAVRLPLCQEQSLYDPRWRTELPSISLSQSLGLNVQSADVYPGWRANPGQVNFQVEVVIANTALSADAQALAKELQISSRRPTQTGLI